MAEASIERPGAPVPAAAPARAKPRRLPAFVRYAIVVVWGAALAALTSYLLRTIGF